MVVQDTTSSIGKSAKHFFSGTMISRCSGLAREVAMAAIFGITPAVAAFWMAFRFAHLLRRLFGEGALHAAFVPHFETLRTRDPAQGAHFFYGLSMAITKTLLFITLLIEGILGAILWFFPPSSGNEEVIRLTMLMLPALVFISLYALNTSLLHCERTYFLPSVAPTFLNLIWIVAILLLHKLPATRAIEYLAMVIVFAFAMQWVATLPPVYHYLKGSIGEGEKQKIAWLPLLRPFALGMIGVAATQVNSAVDSLFARAADPEGPAYLWYALRIQQLPLALVGVALTGAILPPLSRAIQNDNKGQYIHFLNFALKQATLLLVPMMAAIFALGFCGINLVYGHGAFLQPAIIETTVALWAYGVALLPMTTVLILAAAFYAYKNYKIPSLVALFTVVLNIGLNALFVFVFHWGAVSIALATSAAAIINTLALAHFLHRKYTFSLSGLPLLAFKTILASLFAATITIVLAHHLLQDNTLSFLCGSAPIPMPRLLLPQLTSFSLQSLVFIATFVIAAYLLRLHELFALLRKPLAATK